MSVAIKCIKESLAKPNLSKKARQALETRLAELEKPSLPSPVKHTVTKDSAKRSELMIMHPELGNVGHILRSLVDNTASYRYRGLLDRSILSYQDIWQTGMLGALRALGRYDISKGASLKTFLEWRVNGAIVDLMRTVDCAKRTDRERVNKVIEKHREVAQELQNEIPKTLIAREMGKEYEDAFMITSSRIISLDGSVVSGNEDLLFVEIIPSEEMGPYDLMIENTWIEKLWEIIENLSERDRAIASMLLEETRPIDISVMFNISESRISQIKAYIVKEIRLGLKGYIWNE